MAVKSGSDKNSSIDEDLRKLLEARQAEIKVVGVGGAGNNTVSRLMQVGVAGAEIIAINTDAQDLLYTDAEKKVLIGRELTKGLGAGADPNIGMDAARESREDIKEALERADMVFITCGLGGGTGTGASPIVADVAKKIGALTVAIVTLPFSMEGKQRMDNAKTGLENLEKVADTLIVVPNDKLLEIVPDVSIVTAFKVSDEILVNAAKGTAELVTKPGLVNLDFADIKAVMVDGGVSLIGMGESDSANRAVEAVEKAIQNPLLDVDISNATGALINIVGGPDMSLDECKVIIENVGNKLSPDAKLIWGAQIAEDMEKSIRVLLIVTGVRSSQILGHGESLESMKHREIEEELGIDFIE